MIAGLENNITLYVIDHNSLYNVKLMDGKDINNHKKLMQIQYNFNFNAV